MLIFSKSLNYFNYISFWVIDILVKAYMMNGFGVRHVPWKSDLLWELYVIFTIIVFLLFYLAKTIVITKILLTSWIGNS